MSTQLVDRIERVMREIASNPARWNSPFDRSVYMVLGDAKDAFESQPSSLNGNLVDIDKLTAEMEKDDALLPLKGRGKRETATG